MRHGNSSDRGHQSDEPVCSLIGWGTARADLAAIAAMRKTLPAWAPKDTPGHFLKHADEQTVLAVAAVDQAIQLAGIGTRPTSRLGDHRRARDSSAAWPAQRRSIASRAAAARPFRRTSFRSIRCTAFPARSASCSPAASRISASAARPIRSPKDCWPRSHSRPTAAPERLARCDRLGSGAADRRRKANAPTRRFATPWRWRCSRPPQSQRLRPTAAAASERPDRTCIARVRLVRKRRRPVARLWRRSTPGGPAGCFRLATALGRDAGARSQRAHWPACRRRPSLRFTRRITVMCETRDRDHGSRRGDAAGQRLCNVCREPAGRQIGRARR